MMKSILLNPGPVTLSDGVRAAAVSVDLCHREPEYSEIQTRVLDGLVAVYDCDPAHWRAVTLGGSGTAALESMMTSLAPRDARVLVLENGVYGERMARVLEIHDIAHDRLGHRWGEALDLDRLADALRGGDFSHVAAVHHETTTGRLNPLEDLLEACQRHGARLLLDAVSSFGAEAIPFDHPALEACAATANKCLHGIPGMAFVLCRAHALDAAPRRSLYLHLPDWARQQRSGSTPYTPPTHAGLALDRALSELALEGGWRGRRARYRELAERLRRALAGLGVTPWLPASESSCVLRSYRLPPGYDFARVHSGLKSHGFIIYEGQGGLASEMFRVSTMGNIADADLERLETALADVFAEVRGRTGLRAND